MNKLKIRSQETGQETVEESDSGVMRNKPGLSKRINKTTLQYFYFLVTTIRKLKIKVCVCVHVCMYLHINVVGLLLLMVRWGEGEVTHQTTGSLVYGLVYKEALG